MAFTVILSTGVWVASSRKDSARTSLAVFLLIMGRTSLLRRVVGLAGDLPLDDPTHALDGVGAHQLHHLLGGVHVAGGRQIAVFNISQVIGNAIAWAFLAPVFTLLFLWSKGSKSKTGWAFIISMLLFGGLNFAGGLGRFSMETNLIYALGSMMGIALAGIVIVIFYNGRRIEKGSVFSKWFFYWFYPLHLLLLGILRVIYMGIS